MRTGEQENRRAGGGEGGVVAGASKTRFEFGSNRGTRPPKCRATGKWRGIRRRQGGFTLLEVLVASAIIALLVAQVAMTLYVAFRARKSAESGVEESRAMRYAMNTLGRDIQYSYNANNSALAPVLGTDATTSWGGAGDTLRTATVTDPARPFEGGADYCEVTLALVDASEVNTTDTGLAQAGAGVGQSAFLAKPEDAGQAVMSNPEGGTPLAVPGAAAGGSGEGVLVRRVRRRLLSQTANTAVDQVICRHVKSFDLRYYDATQAMWLEEWDGETLGYGPVAVEVTIELAGTPVRKMTRVFTVTRSDLGKVTTTTGGGT
jgi:prepilin-type N-terminal cleavage/methylation domain-containing protein